MVEYGEAKGGRSGGKKRPGAERTDNVKKAICNGALLKFKNPECKYVIYFSAPPKPGSSSDEMIRTALAAGYVDEVRYLNYAISLRSVTDLQSLSDLPPKRAHCNSRTVCNPILALIIMSMAS